MAAKVDRFRQFAANDSLFAIYQASRKSWRAAAWLVNYLDRRAQRRPPLKPGAAGGFSTSGAAEEAVDSAKTQPGDDATPPQAHAGLLR